MSSPPILEQNLQRLLARSYVRIDPGDLEHAVQTLAPLADEKVMPLVAVYNDAGAVSIEAARKEKKPEERIEHQSSILHLLIWRRGRAALTLSSG